MESALDLADAPRIDVEDILTLHRKLFGGTRDERFGGQIRAEQNWVGGTGMSPCTADFVPPPPDRVHDLLEDLCAYISGDEHPALVQAAIAHAQFETIHPFVDGNGRTGRALIHLILKRRGLAPRVVPPISLVLASHADAYVSALTAYRYEGAADSRRAQEGIGPIRRGLISALTGFERALARHHPRVRSPTAHEAFVPRRLPPWAADEVRRVCPRCRAETGKGQGRLWQRTSPRPCGP
ncbi:Fic family protein [Microbispora rosea]|nr:Fic family protein [Microbispora rosea]